MALKWRELKYPCLQENHLDYIEKSFELGPLFYFDEIILNRDEHLNHCHFERLDDEMYFENEFHFE